MIFQNEHNTMRRLLIILHLLLFIMIVNPANSQSTNPVPYDLSNGTYRLLSWDSSAVVNPAGTYPPNMIFHQSKKIDPQLDDEMDTDWKCPYNLDSRSRICGLGDDGIGFINTGQVQEDSVCSDAGFVGEAVLALRTINFKNINVSWKSGLVSLSGRSNRQYCIRFQYRLGNSGDFVDILDSTGNPVEYNYSFYLNDYPHPPHEQILSVTLPLETENRILVHLRWKYYYIPNDSASGTRPKMKVDDIVVNGEIINSIQDEDSPGFSINSVFPNPANDKIEAILFSNNNSEIKIEIIDIFGSEIISIDNYKAEQGVNRIEIDLTKKGLSSGIYFISLRSEFKAVFKKFEFIE